MTYAEKVETIYRSFVTCLDLDIAINKVQTTKEEREKILSDELLLIRLDNHLNDIREDLIEGLLDLKTSNNEPIKLRAILELGKMLYKKRFIVEKKEEKKDLDQESIPDKIILVGGE